MSSRRSREVILLCNQSMTKMQSVSDYLLLSNDLRPIRGSCQSLASYEKCRESILTRTKGLLVLTGRMRDLLENPRAEMEEAGEVIPDFCELTVGLVECCTHLTYTIVSGLPGCSPAREGSVDAYTVHKACLQLRLSCDRLRSCCLAQLTQRVLLELCTDVNNNLGVLADCCKHACVSARGEGTREQFRLCIRSFTTCGSSLMNCIRSFKEEPTETLHQRCSLFCEPLLSSVRAAQYFSGERQFRGHPPGLSQTGREIKLEILGACLSITSANIHMCRCIKNLVLHSDSATCREDGRQCMAAIAKASAFLGHILSKYQRAPESGTSSPSPSIGDLSERR